MIELIVKEYCQDCPDFEALVTIRKDNFEDVESCRIIKRCNTTVTCSHAKRCEGIKRYPERSEKDKK